VILVDSSVWIAYFNGVGSAQTDRLDALLGTEPLLTGDLIFAEVLQGFRADSDFRAAQHVLDRLEFASMLGRDMALASAQNYRRLRAAGVTVRKTIDMMIGTFCIENGHALLHADRDFDAMEEHLGLRVVR
jgi:predicted nucleic acid-binding protein